MKRLRDVWKWNPFSPFGSYALLYIEKSMHIEWLSSNGRPCYIYDHIYIYMRIYPTKYILYLYLAKQLDKQHLLKLIVHADKCRTGAPLFALLRVDFIRFKQGIFPLHICIVCENIN